MPKKPQRQKFYKPKGQPDSLAVALDSAPDGWVEVVHAENLPDAPGE